MYIEQYLKVIDSCRFCFMCRHLAAAGNASGRECDTPRVRALIAGRLLCDPQAVKNPDYAETLFEADLTGANRRNCVEHYDEVGLTIAMRRDFIAAGNVPAPVEALAAELTAAVYRAEGQGEVLLLESGYAPSDAALRRLTGAAAVMQGAEAFKKLAVLGYAAEAAESFGRFKAAVAGFKTIVTASTALCDALRREFEGVPVIHSTEFLLDAVKAGKLAAPQLPAASLIASDYLRNYGASGAPEELFDAITTAPVLYGISDEESYSAGEGAMVLDRVAPGLLEKLAARAASAANAGVKTLTASPHTAAVLRAAGVDIVTFEELFAGC